AAPAELKFGPTTSFFVRRAQLHLRRIVIRRALGGVMRVVFVLLIVMVARAAAAQELSPADAPPLHLADAIAFARAHHPSLKGAAARVTAARQGAEVARSLMPPMFDATIWQWPVTSFNPGDVNMYMFMLEQELPGKGKRDLRAAASVRTADRMAADAAVRTRTIESGVIEAYAALRATGREIGATRA